MWDELLIASAGLAVAASLGAFVVMGWDKRRAARGGGRVPEATLHLFELLGGWPGSFAASAVFRHKTMKLSYRAARWGCVVVHAGAVGGLVWLAYGR